MSGKNVLILMVSAAVLISGCAGKSRLKLGESGEGEVVEAEGLAAVTDDKIGVKRAALADAYKNAIEKVVGILISAKTMVDKAVTIQHSILGKTDGYIKKHDVLREGVEADGLYHTHIRALVSYQQIQQDLKDLDVFNAPLVGNQRLAILLDETVDGFAGQQSACSDALAQGLVERGYKVVDRSELAAIRVAEVTQALLAEGGDKALKPIVQKLNADVVIVGKVTAQQLQSQALGGLLSYRGTISAKALRAQSGEILAAVVTQASGLDATKDAASQKALSQLGKNAAVDFAPKIASELARRGTVLVTVEGIDDLNTLLELKTALSRAPGVSDVVMRSFAAGRAEMEAKVSNATSSDLAGSVAKASAFKGASLLSQTQETIEFKLP